VDGVSLLETLHLIAAPPDKQWQAEISREAAQSTLKIVTINGNFGKFGWLRLGWFPFDFLNSGGRVCDIL
jgi:hypothetical protein